MSYEAWQIVKRIEVDNVELELALQCAPLIAGLKISNLLNIRAEDVDKLISLIKDGNLSYRLLYANNYRATVLLYNEKLLTDYISRDEVKNHLNSMGYEDTSLSYIFDKFCKRYEEYMIYKEKFPHEMGFLLGYPVEDIEGFINHNGEKSLYTGYWKVYKDCEKKLKVFESFENAKESLVNLLYHGIGMAEIIRICCNHNRRIQINYL
ncbi:MAG: DUF3793 family protein [Lachnospiraceae bacterium]|nr:DUF3793 family protein [Lachnospiraceae bacterium]